MNTDINVNRPRPSDKGILVRNLSYVLGLVTGALAMNLFAAKPAGGNNRRRRIVNELAEEIQLNRTQRAEVEQILSDARRRFAGTGRSDEGRQLSHHPRLIEIRRATRSRIRALLTPTQQAFFDDWIHKRDAKRNRFMTAESITDSNSDCSARAGQTADEPHAGRIIGDGEPSRRS
jgi:Spy/CpxP family protein refolding chaperone